MNSASNPESPTTLLYLGQISKEAFVISISIILGLCWITAAIRFYVRLVIQRAFSIDDGLLIFGLCSLTIAVALDFSILNKAYPLESFLFGQETLAFQPGFLVASEDYHKFSTIFLISCWVAISCVKLSFMFLFRRLIDRLHYIVIYWWIVLIFIIVVAIYGIAAYVLACPYYYNIPESIRCVTGSGLQRAVSFAVSQTILDAIGDIFILVIPIHVVWKIKVGKKQKFWLAMSLCLTIVMIAVTITRAVGIKTPIGQLDAVREDFWTILSAQVGLIMASATSFRAFYISTAAAAARNRAARSSTSSNSWLSTLLQGTKHFLVRVLDIRKRTTSQSTTVYESHDPSGKPDSLVNKNQFQSLPIQINLQTLPRAHMTGVQSFVERVGQDSHSTTVFDLMQSHQEEAVTEISANSPGSESDGVAWIQQHQRIGYATHYPREFDGQHPGQQEYV